MTHNFEKISSKLPPEEAEKIKAAFEEKGCRLEEDLEYFIIPAKDEKGKDKKIFVPKRSFLDVVQKDSKGIMRVPVEKILEAAIAYPNDGINEALKKIEKQDKQTKD